LPLGGPSHTRYLPEAAHPYWELASNYQIDFASPKGGVAPVDENSVKTFTDEGSVKFLNDPKTKALYENTKKLSDVKASDYAAIFVVGGVSALPGSSDDDHLIRSTVP
jgi:putative intracellular protease/amidase